MDTKVLYASAIVIAAISGGYYYYSGKGEKLSVDAASNKTYVAKGVQLTQTDEQGNLHIKAQVDRLEQDMQKQTSQLDHLKAFSYKNGNIDATFYAKKAQGFNDNEKVVLSDHVVATKIGEQGQMTFSTDQLTGFPKTRQLETDCPVVVTSPQADFVSQGLKANLNEGQYEFFNIRGKYEPKS